MAGGADATASATTVQANALGILRRSIWLISLPFGILGFVLPIFGKQIGAGAAQIGLFFSVFSLMTVLLRPLVGAGLDRYGRRRFFLFGLAGYGLTMFAFAFANGVWAIVAARTLQGISSAFLWLAAQAVTADVAGEQERALTFGRVEQSSWQGAMLGTFVGFGVLVPLGLEDGWQWLFMGYGAISVVALWLAWRRLPETYRPEPTVDRRPIVWTRPWVLLLLVTAVTGASVSMLAPIMMIYLQDKLSAGVSMLALAYVPAALVWVLLPAWLGRLADRYGRKPLMVFGLAVASVSSFVIPFLTSLLTLAILWVVQELCYAAGDPAERALVADLTGGDQRGRAYGLYALAAGLGATVGPFVGGWLYETVGPHAPFYANGFVLALCMVVLWALLQVPSGPAGGVVRE